MARPLARPRPLWYRGNILPQSIEFNDQAPRTILSTTYQLNGHELDEIIDEALTNHLFRWKGEDGIASYLGVVPSTLKQILLTWNRQKIRFAQVAADTPGNDKIIREIAGPAFGAKCWQRYRLFIEKGGCPQPVDPAFLFYKFKPRTHPSPLSNWSGGFRSLGFGEGGVRKG